MLALFWAYKNGTRVPFATRENSSGLDVYMEKFAGTSRNLFVSTWIRILHFNNATLSASGEYTCAANLNGKYSNKSVEVQVSGK